MAANDHTINARTHMAISFGWGEKYIVDTKTAADIMVLMSKAVKVSTNVNHSGAGALFLYAGPTNVTPTYLSNLDEFYLDLTESDTVVKEFMDYYKTTKELGGNEAVEGLTFTKYLTEIVPNK